MAKEQDQIEFQGVFGIMKKSVNIISSRPKLFAKLALFFILPLNFCMLVNIATTKLISKEINNYSSTLNEDINLFSSRLIILYLLQAICFIISFKYSLLSISTVVYSASCIYNSEEITLQKALSVALKVRKRLALTMVCQILLTNAYTFVTTIIVFYLNRFGGIKFEFPSKQSDLNSEEAMLMVVLLVFGLILVIYMTFSWQLANIITILDDYSGFKAMKKSRQLIKGNYGTGIAMFLVLLLGITPMFIIAMQLVGIDISNSGVGPIILYGIISLVYNPMVMLFFMVVQTMFYFVCKSYHHESIDVSSFTDCLDLSKSNGDYFPLKNEIKKIDQLDV